ncbi:MAG: lamin tail domain-containing protein [Candidatus Sungbacteria bacterium]|uniref:Lamin tail domain-containing protein n=1 Tax=Candidatus Sungiibacteriota bacterium TaxID=2750080 RepID=A0A932YY55_9BACT|nr:lamin tail domain-containing protein [Candidatus Sungbacteria bacterium]
MLAVLGNSIFLTNFVSASVVINEILFDPSGTDTGLEKIEIYNPDATAADMGGWELYPDGIGYFPFPVGFSLAAQSFVTIHLRTSGTNDAANLYHSAASLNMGNSSGSVALFRFGGRTKDTIVDFVRYHKPGSSEKKTWESTAVEAGLWAAGTYFDISGFSEGSSIGLTADGVRGSAASWQAFASPSLGSANAVGSGSIPPPPPAAPEGTPPASEPAPVPAPPPAPPPAPSLGADAGPDALAIAGAIIQFNGLAFGLDGKPLDATRYFWNFGDGSTQEKQSPTHIFHFPGTYYVNLLVQSGHYAGSDWRTVSVLPAEISISEVQPGENGFIELTNASAARVDVGGMFLTDDRRAVFRIPQDTVVGSKSTVVLPALNTHIVPTTYVDLRDARGVTLDAARFSGMLPPGVSWERDGYEFRPQSNPTPGKLPPSSPGASAVTPRVSVASPSLPASPKPQPPPGGPPVEPQAPVGSSLPPAPPPTIARKTEQSALIGSAGVKPYAFLGASVVLGLLTAAGMVVLKRKAF